MEAIDAAIAFGRGRQNAYRRWGGRKLKQWPIEAAKRLLASGPLEIGHVPKFKITPGSTIFTIGSCFARNIETKLGEAGMDVPATRFEPPPGIYKFHDGTIPNAALNKFTTHSISHELSRVLEGHIPPNRGFIPDDGGLWYDPQATFSGEIDWDTANSLRDRIEATTAQIRTADAVFITLGLTEGWFDTETGVHLNGILPIRLMRRHPGRFQFVNPGFVELANEMHRIVSMIQMHGKPDVKVLVTVSPVPLLTTFTEQDVIVANNWSKSVLRAVAQSVCTMENVDYFPSYEMVVFSERGATWADDQRHVEIDMIDAVTRRFIELYVD